MNHETPINEENEQSNKLRVYDEEISNIKQDVQFSQNDEQDINNNYIEENKILNTDNDLNNIREISTNQIKNDNIINNFENTFNDGSDIDLMDKLDKEETKKVTEKDIFNKYENMTDDEIFQLIKSKNKEILDLSNSQDDHKNRLNNLLENLNEAIDKSTKLNPKNNNQQSIKMLEKTFESKQKELVNSKSQAKIYKQQYELLIHKANERFSTDKIYEMEENIEKLKKENIESLKKVKYLKNLHLVNSKELEALNLNKKYPNQINAYTDEIKSLVVKKHDYFDKLNKNKKSLKNLKEMLSKSEKNFYDTLNKVQKGDKNSDSLISMINDIIKSLRDDLNVDEKDFLEKVNIKEMAFINIIEEKKSKTFNPKQIKSNVILPNIRQESNPRKISKTVSKNEYKDKTKRFKNGKSSDIIDENHENDSFELDNMKYDYDNTLDSDYTKLVKKNETLILTNTKIEKNIKESEKLNEKKLRDIQSTIEHNAKRLKHLQLQNELLTQEIGDLTKILKLSLEENKLKKELKENESKLYKNNDVSETRNEILQDLNNILGEGNYSNNYLGKNKIEIVKEEVLESNDSNFINLENNDNNEKPKFPDISNVEHIEEDNLNNRANIIDRIKNKYDIQNNLNLDVEKID